MPRIPLPSQVQETDQTDPILRVDVRVVSFDVFDTAVTRIVAEPTGVFHLLQRQLTGDRLSLPAGLIEQFPVLRAESERQARVESGKEEITLAEIYQVLGAKFQLASEMQAQLVELELEQERRTIRPVAPTIQLISRVRQRRLRVVFVSDSYLPQEFIREMLVCAGAWLEGDGLYVSSEHRVMKATGRLFQRMLGQEHCAPNEVCHIGDNPGSDVRAPRRLGIYSVQFLPGAGTWSA